MTATTITPISERAVVVPVALADRSYDIVIGSGLLDQAGRLIAERFSGRCSVVTDQTVADLYLDRLRTSLEAVARYRGAVVVAPGEASKSFPTLARVSEELLSLGTERGDIVIALGGGVVGDLAGFAAAILRRGVRMVQMPTTLLAQVDSSVGGKTGINTPEGKNLIGAFYQPSLVLADMDVLDTLPRRQMLAGYAEVAKYGLLGDAEFFAWLEGRGLDVVTGSDDKTARAHAIAVSCAAKSAIVARDERETGDRALLNLGHTFGHALETFTGYSDRLLHGEAVAIGMVLAFRLSEQLGVAPAGTAARVAAHLASLDLPVSIRQLGQGPMPTANDLIRLMGQDKKVEAGKLVFILARGIGHAYIARDIDVATVAAMLHAELAA